MSKNKEVKTAATSKVVPAGGFVNSLVLEFVRRMIRNGERIANLMDEVKERFPNAGPEDCYALLSELQQLGFDCTPSDWLFATPVEYRAAALKNLSMFKSAAIHGSRYEDISELIKAKEAGVKECQAWLKENEKLQKTSPQTYFAKRDQTAVLEDEIAQLKELLKVSKASVVYDRTHLGGVSPLTPLNVIVSNGVHLLVKTAAGDLAISNPEDISGESAMTEAKELSPTEVTGLQLDELYVQELSDNKALEPFYGKYMETQSPHDTLDTMTNLINGFVDFIEREKETKDPEQMTPEQVNQAYEALAGFVHSANTKLAERYGENGPKLTTKVDSHYKEELANKPDEQKVDIGESKGDINVPPGAGTPIDESDIMGGANIGNKPPSADDIGVSAASRAAVKTSETKDTEIAAVMQYLDKIARLLTDVKASSTIPKTAHVDAAIENLQGSITDIRHFVQESLPYQTSTERLAARTVLSNIMKKLASLIDIYSGKSGQQEVIKYLMASDFLKVVKTAKILLTTLGD